MLSVIIYAQILLLAIPYVAVALAALPSARDPADHAAADSRTRTSCGPGGNPPVGSRHCR